jgi:hypothetical protein
VLLRRVDGYLIVQVCVRFVLDSVVLLENVNSIGVDLQSSFSHGDDRDQGTSALAEARRRTF